MCVVLISGRYPPCSDGIGDYTASLAAALRAAGWPVAVLCSDGPRRARAAASARALAIPAEREQTGTPENRAFDPRAEREAGAVVVRLPRWDSAGLAMALAALRRLRPVAVLWQYNPFSFGRKGLCPEYALLPWLARHATGAPVVATLHELAYPWGRGGARGRVWAATQRLQLALIARTASALVATTGQRAAWLRQRWPTARIVRLPVGSSLPATQLTAQDRTTIRTRLGLPAKAYLLGAFGTLNDGRPLAATLGALAQVPDAWLVWVGDLQRAEDRQAHWQHVADALGVGCRLRWTGRLPADEAAATLAACDALLALYDEGLSGRRTTLAAALAQARPVLGNSGPATDSDLFTPGLAFAPVADDAASIVKAVTRLRADAAEAARLAAGARATYVRWLAWERIAAGYGALLAALGVVPTGDGRRRAEERAVCSVRLSLMDEARAAGPGAG